MNLPIEVIEAVNEARCVLFVGPTFSLEAAQAAGREYPEGKDLARELGWKKPKTMIGARKTVVIPSPAEGAAATEAQIGRAGLVARVRGLLDVSDAAPTEAHRAALRRFPLLFTTNYDDLLERAAREMGGQADVAYRNDPVPDADPARRFVYKLWGGFERPDTLLLTAADHKKHEFNADMRRAMRNLIRRQVIFFVGYRPDEEHFERLWTDLTEVYGGELPRCHLAVAQGQINDYLWQKWVWRGLLMFTADPSECMSELENRIAK